MAALYLSSFLWTSARKYCDAITRLAITNDRDLIAIDPDTMTVCIAPNLLKDYGEFNNKDLRLPKKKQLSPNIEALRSRYKKYQSQTGFLNSAWIKVTN